MRKLLLLRGAPGSGKTRFVNQRGLSELALSLDAFRELFSTPVPVLEGVASLVVSQAVEAEVVRAARLAAANRMDLGATLVIDATMLTAKYQSEWAALGRKYGYEALLLDIQGDVSDEELLARNRGRGNKAINEPRLLEMAAKGRMRNLSGLVREIRHDELQAEFATAEISLEQYERVLIVGDVQSCGGALSAVFAALGELNDRATAWVFVGDLFDRGPDAGEVFAQLHTAGENVFFITGNHELHLRSVIHHTSKTRLPATRISREQIERRGFTQADILALLDRTRAWLPFTFGGRRYVASHGGVTTDVLEARYRPGDAAAAVTGWYDAFDIPDHWFVYGASTRSDTWQRTPTYTHVDAQLAARSQLAQFHGHRNGRTTDAPEAFGAVPGVWNLEARVDAGGQLRVAELHRDGSVTCHEFVEPPVSADVAAERAAILHSAQSPGWAGRAKDAAKDAGVSAEAEMSADAAVEVSAGAAASADTQAAVGATTIAADAAAAAAAQLPLSQRLAQHPYIRTQPLDGGVVAYNFTGKAFVEGHWDVGTMAARGLFLRGDAVVARGYQKFFNLGEPYGYTKESVLDEFEYPVKVREKVNGYLGITAWLDERLVFWSKSGATEYGDAFARTFAEQFSAEQQDALAAAAREHAVTLVFEVVRCDDPHIVEYEGAQFVSLLDAIANQEAFALRGDVVAGLAERLGAALHQPRTLTVAHTRAELAAAIDAAERSASEGAVLVDARGRMAKVKSPWYWHRRRLRTELEQFRAGQRTEFSEEYAAEARFLYASGRLSRLDEFVVITPAGHESIDTPAVMRGFNG